MVSFVQVSMIIEAEYARAVRLLEENKDKLEMFASMLMVKKVGCCWPRPGQVVGTYT
jgi:hypothetical protein